MRALRYARYGPPDVLEIVEVDEPVPRAGEVKVRVQAAGLNPVDGKIRAGHLRWLPFVARPPRGCGHDFAGEVVGTGGDVAGYFPGLRVYGSLSPLARDGAFAPFVCVAPERIAPSPTTLDFAHAAALPVSGGTAMQALVDHMRVAAGQRVLVNGASGGVGHLAVQLARNLGAHVTATCGPDNVEFVRSLGADTVLDHTRDDFTAGDTRYDAILDAAGRSSWRRCRNVLEPRGVYVNTSPDARAIAATLADLVAARFARQRVVAFVLDSRAETWRRLARLVDEGAMAPHVRETIGLPGVADAQRRMETGHGRGKVVVDPSR
ncbi:MAG: NAD(P)-dependent alcohol dehydrogenase [Betaproteobacteria bacterium]